MQDKIKWYEEILALEPSSKLFYPLARLYLEAQELDRAASVLNSGLEKHPEFFQARLLLLDILHGQGQTHALQEQMQQTLAMLAQNHNFWQLAAEYYEKQGDHDLAVALRFLGQGLQGRHLGWVQLLQQALQDNDPPELTNNQRQETRQEHKKARTLDLEAKDQAGLSEGAAGQQAFDVDEQDADPGEQARMEAEQKQSAKLQYKTMTMAEILAKQGDFHGALEIYAWLLEQAQSRSRQIELQKRVDELRQKVDSVIFQQEGTKDLNQDQAKKKSLLLKLEKLAARLESKAKTAEKL